MKKTLFMLFAAAAFVGCEQGEPINEPSGAERDMQMEQRGTNDTNTLSDPAGAPQSDPLLDDTDAGTP